MTRAQMLIEEAKKYIGVLEVGGDNRGPEVEEFQKAVDGTASDESWCLCFAQYCIKKVDAAYLAENPQAKPSPIFQTEHCLTLWNRTPPQMRLSDPEPGCLVVWQFYRNGVPTPLGHVGIVVETRDADASMNVVEGNTSPAVGVERNGQGVYMKQRSLLGGSVMRIKGYIRVWPEDGGGTSQR